MKKIILFLFMSLVMMATSLNAQNHVQESKVFDNVYVTVNVGTQVPTTDIAFDNFRAIGDIEIAKRLNTYYTTGLAVGTGVNSTGVKTAFDHVDFTWVHKVNVFNLFNYGYDPNRKFELEAVGEIGLGHYTVIKDWHGVASAGVEAVYNFNPTWAFVAKPSIEWRNLNDGLNVNNSNLQLTVGVRFNLPNVGGGRGFKVCDRDDLYAKYTDLNNEINQMRQYLDGQKAINRQLNDELARTVAMKNKVDTVYVENVGFIPTISFQLNSAKIHPLFRANIHNIATSYAGKKIVVEGYADAQTGSAEYNLALSKRRAEAVKKALIEQGLKEEDIEVRACGSASQIFKDNDLNRAAIIVK